MKRTKTRSKLPKKLPMWVCKAAWDATAILLKVEARNEQEAWDCAWKRIARTEGGDSCLKVTVLRQVNS